MGLKEKLADFEQAYIKGEINESTISSRFKDIARSIIYGGYIDVYGEFKIYAKTIEFYFHEEEGSIKDPIVYHRNGKYGDLLPFPPYFPTTRLLCPSNQRVFLKQSAQILRSTRNASHKNPLYIIPIEMVKEFSLHMLTQFHVSY